MNDEPEKPLPDITFREVSAYGSKRWVAARLGASYDWFLRNKDDLFKKGLPQPDPIFGRWIKADIDDWINSRRRRKSGEVETRFVDKTNYDAF